MNNQWHYYKLQNYMCTRMATWFDWFCQWILKIHLLFFIITSPWFWSILSWRRDVLVHVHTPSTIDWIAINLNLLLCCLCLQILEWTKNNDSSRVSGCSSTEMGSSSPIRKKPRKQWFVHVPCVPSLFSQPLCLCLPVCSDTLKELSNWWTLEFYRIKIMFPNYEKWDCVFTLLLRALEPRRVSFMSKSCWNKFNYFHPNISLLSA